MSAHYVIEPHCDRKHKLAADYDNRAEHEAVLSIPAIRSGLRQKYELLRSGCPDLRFVVEDLMSAGERVASRVTVRGTHTQPFLGRAPSGRQMGAGKHSFYRVAGEKMSEHWGIFDQFA